MSVAILYIAGGFVLGFVVAVIVVAIYLAGIYEAHEQRGGLDHGRYRRKNR